MEEVTEKGTEGNEQRKKEKIKEGSERWGLEQQRERLTGLKERDLNENI